MIIIPFAIRFDCPIALIALLSRYQRIRQTNEINIDFYFTFTLFPSKLLVYNTKFCKGFTGRGFRMNIYAIKPQ